MTPLFITAIGKFIRQTKGWWIGLVIVVIILAILALIVWAFIVAPQYAIPTLVVLGFVGLMYLMGI